MGRVLRVNFRHAELLGRVAQNVPATLLRLPIWLLYGANKVPMYVDGTPRRGKLDSPGDREQLVDFDTAAAAISRIRTARGLGIALGHVPGHNIRICGIDLDHCFSGETLEERAQAVMQEADSYSERSPSGDGLHILGIGDAGTTKGNGLEVYSDRRYFTVTGQVLKSAELKDLAAGVSFPRLLYSDYFDRTIKTEIPQGRRNNTLAKIGGRLRHDGLETRELQTALQIVNRLACKPPLDVNEVSRIANSVGRYAFGGDSPKPDAAVPPVTFTSIADIVAQRRETQWLLPKILERRVLAVLVGKRSTYKSFIALDWSLRAAVDGAGIVILSAEGGGLERRINAWIKRHAPGTDPALLHVVALEQPKNLNYSPQLQAVSDAIAKLKWKVDLVVIDTMSKFSPGLEENSNSDVAAFLATLSEGIRDRHDCTVLLVVHAGHAERGRPRGASALMANPDAEYVVERADALVMTVTVTRERFKDSPALPALAYTAEVIELGRVDDSGEPVTSLALVAADAPARKVKGAGANQTKAMTALRKWCRANEGEFIRSEELRSLFKAQNIERNRKSEVLRFLVNAGILTVADGGQLIHREAL